MILTPIPFPEEENTLAYPDTSIEQIGVMAAKKLINTLFMWKNKKYDASGNKFDFDKNVESLDRALNLLFYFKEITDNQVKEITKYLSDGRFE